MVIEALIVAVSVFVLYYFFKDHLKDKKDVKKKKKITRKY